ncbi:MAG: VOC family protein [Rhodocyclaceae bacterium]|nr:VOC family protein [Pseudomonadota bacterium]MDQ7975603.1 VOC family protein [Rhodocyclaceae bacterium]MDQ8001762.1 VOC family protein [Pseudomonadota bacterium]
MHSANTWFEIPVADLAKSQRFYETLLDRPMRGTEDFGGETMAVFAHEKPGAGGCIVHRPAQAGGRGGTVVYLDCAPGVDAALARAQAAGGTVVVGRTLIAPGVGYFAQVQDLDGNLVGLHAAD